VHFDELTTGVKCVIILSESEVIQMPYNCSHCWNQFQFTTDAVASCNCCEDGEFFVPMKEEEEYDYQEEGNC
jgi:hypothetical protein